MKSVVFRQVPVIQIRPDSWISEEPTFEQVDWDRVEEMKRESVMAARSNKLYRFVFFIFVILIFFVVGQV